MFPKNVYSKMKSNGQCVVTWLLNNSLKEAAKIRRKKSVNYCNCLLKHRFVIFVSFSEVFAFSVFALKPFFFSVFVFFLYLLKDFFFVFLTCTNTTEMCNAAQESRDPWIDAYWNDAAK